MVNAGDDFLENFEECTNFVVPQSRSNQTSRPRKSATTQGREKVQTILGQVKKYGVNEVTESGSGCILGHHGNRFIRTSDGVTDDPENYLEPHDGYKYSYLDPPPPAKKPSEKIVK